MQGRADVAAIMLLDLRDMEMAAALAQIVNAAMVREQARNASRIAGASLTPPLSQKAAALCSSPIVCRDDAA